MAATGYTRQSAAGIVDTAIITASLFNAEYNLLETAFSAADGHTHDGAGGQGGRILAIGPTGELIVGSNSVLPLTNNTLDLGSSGAGFRDLYIKQDASIVRNAAIGGTLEVTGVASADDATLAGHLMNRRSSDVRYSQIATENLFTANQTITKASPSLVLNKAASAQAASVAGQTAGLNRWRVDFGNASAEAGSNAGSDFAIIRYDDAGTSLGNALVINRATAAVTIAGVVTVANTTASTSPTTGSLVAAGGLGVAGAAHIGGALNAAGPATLGNPLVVNSTGADSVIVSNAPNGFMSQLKLHKAGGSRWLIGADASLESGSNAGSNFVLQRFSDAGGFLETVLTIPRNTGVVTFNNATASTSTTTGAVRFLGGVGVSGSLTAGRLALDATAYMVLNSGNFVTAMDANDYWTYDRPNNVLSLIINSTSVLAASSSGVVFNTPAQAVADPTTALGLATKQYADNQRAFRNKLINSGFKINQRGLVSGATLAPSAYGFDRWKAGASGCVMTFPGSGGPAQIVEIAIASSLQQVIEGVELDGGTYVLSWAGTAQGRVNGGAYSASPVVFTTGGGVNVTVEFGAGSLYMPQLERSSSPTPWEARSISVELLLCQRYYAVGSNYRNGYCTAGGNDSRTVSFPTQMRVAPTIGVTGFSLSNVSLTAGTNQTVNSFEIYNTITATGTFQGHANWTASAEI